MEAIRINSVINKSGELLLRDSSFIKGRKVEAFILMNTDKKKQDSKFSGKDLAQSAIVGIWKNRNIEDSVVFANELRDMAQKRESTK